jgi:hypothetical protein
MPRCRWVLALIIGLMNVINFTHGAVHAGAPGIVKGDYPPLKAISHSPERDSLFKSDEWINDGDAVVVKPMSAVTARPSHRKKGILYADVDTESALWGASLSRRQRALFAAGYLFILGSIGSRFLRSRSAIDASSLSELPIRRKTMSTGT